MTRINCVDVATLTDQHLLAEYREITRVAKFAMLLPNRHELRYVLGTGHMKFFYDKGRYLQKRTNQLYRECRYRGFNVVRKSYPKHPHGCNKDWMPDDIAKATNKRRLKERLEHRPGFYTHHRVRV
jgi:deoxyribonuclease (pyrimidine dimer)